MGEPAPFYADVAQAPPEARARWLHSTDGLRLRAAHLGSGARGTVLIFPGRTEMVERHGPLARHLAQAGYGSVAIDWRGQGLSDRLLPDPLMGHVDDFAAYQRDVAALIAWVRGQDLPRPWFLFGNSMGGAIGLRALLGGLPVAAAGFSAPMWKIRLSPAERALAALIAPLTGLARVGARGVPGAAAWPRPGSAPFEGNGMTADPQMFAWIQSLAATHPQLGLGPPTLGWLIAALRETRALRRSPPPPVPALALVGGRETTVCAQTIRRLIARWPGGRLHEEPEAAHEPLMEPPALRARARGALLAHFDAHRG